ncbi:MAG: cation transporter [Microthrixaceae bacterium]|nr:cation transporter [Microthrixaceae bacterium]
MSNVETVKVSGMTCGHCVAAVTEEISKIDGVTGVSADLESGRVEVTSESPVDRALVKAAVDEAGYELVG